jgi:hypothetical protein
MLRLRGSERIDLYGSQKKGLTGDHPICISPWIILGKSETVPSGIVDPQSPILSPSERLPQNPEHEKSQYVMLTKSPKFLPLLRNKLVEEKQKRCLTNYN